MSEKLDAFVNATIAEIKAFFNMEGAAMMAEWKKLSEEEKTYFKEAVGAELDRLGK